MAKSLENMDGEPYIIIAMNAYDPYPTAQTPASDFREYITKVRAFNQRIGSDAFSAAIEQNRGDLLTALHKENVGIDESLLPIFNAAFQPKNASAKIEDVLSFSRTGVNRSNGQFESVIIVGGPVDLVNEWYRYNGDMSNVF